MASLIHRLGTPVLMRLARPFRFSRALVEYGNRPGRVVVALLLMQTALRYADAGVVGIGFARHSCALLLTSALTWFAVRLVTAVEDTIIGLNPVDTADNLQARRILTQTRVLARAIQTLTIVIGIGAALMTLPLMREIGASLLASAGVAGLVVGLAAKPVLGNLLAGMQLALTQPIRLGDVVIIENEWGWIEEITVCYVVVKIWDQRRLVVPLTYFIEKPFQNWTRHTSELLGAVTLWVDFRIPLDPLREEALRLCQKSVHWNGKLCMIQVVDANQHGIQLRALVSSADSSKGWDLRCEVREGLITFISHHYPQHLPRVRANMITKPVASLAFLVVEPMKLDY